jgi:hypothetical protein
VCALDKVDKELLLLLNSFIGYDKLFDKIINGSGENPLVRGFPVFFPLVALWFYDGYQARRGRILAGLFASCLAVFLSVWLQYHVHIHTRPFLDQTLPIKILDPRMVENWDRLGSFPSDTATLYFSFNYDNFPRIAPSWRHSLAMVVGDCWRSAHCGRKSLSKRHPWRVGARTRMRLSHRKEQMGTSKNVP